MFNIVDGLLKDLDVLGHGRSADQLLQDEVAAAEPSIDEKTSKLVSRGRWGVPGYKVCYFLLAEMLNSICADIRPRKNSAISPCYRQHDGHLPFVYFSNLDTETRRTEQPNWAAA